MGFRAGVKPKNSRKQNQHLLCMGFSLSSSLEAKVCWLCELEHSRLASLGIRAPTC